ncbi:hypothetical protein GCM10009665_52730 [Kitasatospora nipponensis]|uniref:Uncharacterized protein n=1 Tax=Kitasatospora nipponensis TaxID=258049 RepID=A0ABN1WQQ6_9ACTN
MAISQVWLKVSGSEGVPLLLRSDQITATRVNDTAVALGGDGRDWLLQVYAPGLDPETDWQLVARGPGRSFKAHGEHVLLAELRRKEAEVALTGQIAVLTVADLPPLLGPAPVEPLDLQRQPEPLELEFSWEHYPEQASRAARDAGPGGAEGPAGPEDVWVEAYAVGGDDGGLSLRSDRITAVRVGPSGWSRHVKAVGIAWQLDLFAADFRDIGWMQVATGNSAGFRAGAVVQLLRAIQDERLEARRDGRIATLRLSGERLNAQGENSSVARWQRGGGVRVG